MRCITDDIWICYETLTKMTGGRKPGKNRDSKNCIEYLFKAYYFFTIMVRRK